MRLTAKHTTQAMINEKNLTKGQMKELKLSQLEDIEDELGIDLITLFKALKDGVYDKYIHYEDICLLRNKIYACPVDIFDTYWYLKDYGKTWALTKEELL